MGTPCYRELGGPQVPLCLALCPWRQQNRLQWDCEPAPRTISYANQLINKALQANKKKSTTDCKDTWGGRKQNGSPSLRFRNLCAVWAVFGAAPDRDLGSWRGREGGQHFLNDLHLSCIRWARRVSSGNRANGEKRIRIWGWSKGTHKKEDLKDLGKTRYTSIKLWRVPRGREPPGSNNP